MSLGADVQYTLSRAEVEKSFDRYFKKADSPTKYGDTEPTEEYLRIFIKHLKKLNWFNCSARTDEDLMQMFSGHYIDAYPNEDKSAIILTDCFSQPCVSVIHFPEVISSLFPDVEILFEGHFEVDCGFCDYYKATYLNGQLLKVLTDESGREALEEEMKRIDEEANEPLTEERKKSDAYEIQDIETYDYAFRKYEY